MEISYKRHRHAAHYMYNDPRVGHDLESWTFASPVNKAEGIPSDAKYAHGFVTNGVQHWVYTRIAPLTGTCPQCARKS